MILADETLHWWFGEHAVAAAIHAQRGVDQGCPFSPALFATLIAGALERVRAGPRLLDESAAVLSYFDDIYTVVSADHAGRAMNYVEQAFSLLGFTLSVAKCKWWCGQAGVAPTGLPASVQRAGVLPVLSSSLPYVVASELGHLDLLDAEAPLAQARDSFHAFWQNLCKLLCAGLCLDTALNLQEIYVNAPSSREVGRTGIV